MPDDDKSALIPGKDDGEEKYQLGLRCLYSPDQEDNIFAATRFKSAVQQGHTDAEFYLGWCYLAGMGGVTRNRAVALEYFLSAAEKRHIDSAFEAGRLLLHGSDGITKDVPKAIELLKRAAIRRHVDAQYEYGTLLLESDEPQAIEWLRKAAERGHEGSLAILEDMGSEENTVAQYHLGVLYQRVFEDDNKASNLFRKAAEKGHENSFAALESLGLRGNSVAQFNLGMMFLNGKGVEKNVDEGEQWLGRSRDQGNLAARNNLGISYIQNADGINASYAINSFAYAGQYAPALYNLGVCYYHGLAGVRRNREEAQRYFSAAVGGVVVSPGEQAARDFSEARTQSEAGRVAPATFCWVDYVEPKEMRRPIAETREESIAEDELPALPAEAEERLSTSGGRWSSRNQVHPENSTQRTL